LSLLPPTSSGRAAKAFQMLCISFFLTGLLIMEASASPIQRVEGVITKVGEGFLLLKPKGQSSERKFILRWTARFTPPKIPFKGDRVLILYKDKEDGAIVYGVNYVRQPADNSARRSGSASEDKRP
jgi:hypothetical protein